jgi:hypothetical protein
MLEKVITGGQTGTDQAALRAARAAGIPTGGWAPKGWLVETADGERTEPAPWLAGFGLAECAEGETVAERYAARRRRNVQDADAVLLFGDPTTPGARVLIGDCRLLGKPCSRVATALTRPSVTVAFLRSYPHIKVLLVAGNRESTSPGVGERTERFLAMVFRGLGHTPPAPP